MLHARPRVVPRGLTLLFVGLAVVMGVLAGGGVSSVLGADNSAVTAAGVTPQALDPALVGSWMHVRARQDGVDGSLKNLEHWEGTAASAVREVSVFKSTGVYTETFYNAAGAVVKFNNGVWSANAGTHTVTINWDGPYSCTYSLSGNVLTLTATGGGHTTQIVLAKLVSLTAHDPALVKTWKATGVWLNGVSKPVSYLNGSTSYPSFARSLLANGTSQRYSLYNDEPRVSYNHVIKLPKLGLQNWATGGGALKLGSGPISEGLYVLAAGKLTTWHLDGAGNTLKVVFSPYGAAGAHDARFVGTWQGVSGTVDGTPTPLNTIFGALPGTTDTMATFWSDGTVENPNHNGTTLFYDELNTWYTISGTIRLQTGGGPFAAGYVFGTGSMTLSWTQEGHHIVVRFNKDD